MYELNLVITAILRVSCIICAYTVWRMIMEQEELYLPGDGLDPRLRVFFLAIAVMTAAAGATLGI